MLLVFRNDYINNGVEMVRECVENVFGPVCQHIIFFWFFPLLGGVGRGKKNHSPWSIRQAQSTCL